MNLDFDTIINKKTMRTIFVFLFMAILINTAKSQDTSLLANIIYPRLDTAFWETDYQKLNNNYSIEANTCQTCFWSRSDTLVKKTCINSTLSHIKLDSSTQIHSTSVLLGEWMPVNIGQIEVADSFVFNQPIGFRNTRIIDKPQKYSGILIFKKQRAIYNLNINGKQENSSERYKLIDNKYIVHNGFLRTCNPRYIGITKTGYLIIDKLQTRVNIYKKTKEKVYITTITRTIFKKTK
jgi:hypothetical protein